MKKISNEIVKGGGIVRSIQNHGIRDLPHRFKAKYADKEGRRYWTKGRFISVYYDSNPLTMQQVDHILKLDEEVLRSTHLRARSVLDYINMPKVDRNPYLKRADKILENRKNNEQKEDEQELAGDDDEQKIVEE
jgi:ribosomal protein S6